MIKSKTFIRHARQNTRKAGPNMCYFDAVTYRKRVYYLGPIPVWSTEVVINKERKIEACPIR